MHNPIAFRRGPVTFWTTIIYLAVLIPLIIVNETVPSAPERSPFEGVNLDQAWLDLTTLTKGYHPYNSKNNDEVRDWLLLRIQQILDQNSASWKTDSVGDSIDGGSRLNTRSSIADVTVFDDLTSNFTVRMDQVRLGTNAPTRSNGGSAVYFEGTNILVYIRGTDDEDGDWWKSDRKVHGGSGEEPAAQAREGKLIGKGGVLVNAHYDSVSTGFGATDDGMGVVSILQIVDYFTRPGHQPKKGIVALLNNGEEDFLNGARAFGKTPLNKFIHTFLNLEGAGAGGRAILFRSSDQEVTGAYSRTKHPFGTVIGSDAFGTGAIRSQTDYVVLNGVFGQRGLDLAFFKPRARYHTNQDDAKHTSKASLWHMLSSAVHTTIELSSDTGDTFIGPRPDGSRNKVPNGSPSDGVWFSILGSGFVLFSLRGMFAWSLTILIAPPLILALVTYLVARSDKYYFFSSKVRTYEHPDFEQPVTVGGIKGFFRFPLALGFATTLTVGCAFLLRKINPLIVYSSPYTVWATMLSLFYFSLWLILRGASAVRPSALQRGYVNIWLFILGWAMLVGVTVLEDRFRIASGYFFVFLESALFLSTLLTLLELFALPKKTAWAQQVREDHRAMDHINAVPNDEDLIGPTASEGVTPAADEDLASPATERTPLIPPVPLLGDGRDSKARTTFATTYRRSISKIQHGVRKAQDAKDTPIADEQPWSVSLPTWTWILQFLLIGPFITILAGETGLILVDAVNQTGPDGSSLLMPYLIIALFTILILLPLSPFIHRVSHHIPNLLLVVCAGTLIYNLATFPFSANNRYKVYFQQTIDLDTGETRTHFHGLEDYVRPIIAEIPSSVGKNIDCGASGKGGLVNCTFDSSSIAPRIGKALPDGIPPQRGYADLVTINSTRGDGNTATIEIDAVDTKACFLHFSRPVSRLDIANASTWDERFGPYPEDGVGLVKLWRRDWNKKWVITVEWTDPHAVSVTEEAVTEGDKDASWAMVEGDDLKVRNTSGVDGYVACQWSDANTPGVIPALDEALAYAPVWAGVTKYAEGLVEGKKRFML